MGPMNAVRRWSTVRTLVAFALFSAVSIVPAAAAQTERDASLAAVTITTDAYTLRAFKWGGESQVRVVTFDGGSGSVVRTSLAYPSFSGKRITSRIGTSSGGVVAVNGGFTILGTYAPKHLTMIEGELITSGKPAQPGWVMTFTADASRAWLSRPAWDTRWSIHATQGALGFDITGWNAQQPRSQQVVAFTARGGDSMRPEKMTCTALLEPVSGDLTRHRVYRVVELRANADCSRRPLQPPAGNYERVVLAGQPVGLLDPNLELEIDLNIGQEGVTNAFGGVPRLLKHGRNVGPNCGGPCNKTGQGPDRPFYARNPRTAVGISQGCSDRDDATTCTWYVVTVDGRLDGWSEGLRFPRLADLMLELGAYEAVNMDGGGSTTMWVRHRNEACQSRTAVGCLVNRPSYGERPHVDSLVLFDEGT